MYTAFITGCASGFGHALAARLLSLGWRVVATDPEIGGLERALAPDAELRARLLVLKMDLADPAAIRGAVYEALEWSPVDLLVNNGGYAIFGTQEEADLDAVERMFSVNVFGAMHLTRALLPTLRARRGTVVQISSVAGRMAFPESGFYAATKHALEALSEALFLETCTFGMRVRVIEPGSFATRFLEHARELSAPHSASSPYAHLHEAWDAAKQGVLEAPQPPALVVDAIVRSLDDARPFLRVPVGVDGERILALRRELSPDGWVSLLAERNGMHQHAQLGEELLSPDEVLALAPDEVPERLHATLAAHRALHLDHWEKSEEGRAALVILAARAAPSVSGTSTGHVSADVLALARQLADPVRLAAAAQAAAQAIAKATGLAVPGASSETPEAGAAQPAAEDETAPDAD